MLKLMKYEFKGRIKLVLGLLFIYILANMFFIIKGYNLVTVKDNEGFYFVLSIFLAIAGLTTVLISAISLFRKDLYQDTSYLIFTLPRSGYSIVGSKLLVSLIEFIVFQFISLLLVYLNFVYAVPISQLPGSLSATSKEDFIYMMTHQVFSNYRGVIIVIIAAIILGFVELLMLIYFSITVSKVIMKTKKYGRLVSFAVFIGTSIIIGKIVDLLDRIFPYHFLNHVPIPSPNTPGIDGSAALGIIGQSYMVSTIFNILIVTALFIATGYLLEKKADI